LQSKHLTGPVSATRKTKKPENNCSRKRCFAVESKDGRRIRKHSRLLPALLTTSKSPACDRLSAALHSTFRLFTPRHEFPLRGSLKPPFAPPAFPPPPGTFKIEPQETQQQSPDAATKASPKAAQTREPSPGLPPESLCPEPSARQERARRPPAELPQG